RPQPVPKVLQAKKPQPAGILPPPVRPAIAAGLVIQCAGIRFKSKYGRTLGTKELAVEELKTWQLEFIVLDPLDPRIEYVGDKMALLDAIKKRLKAIQNEKLKRSIGSGKGYISGTDRYVVAIHPRPDTPTRKELEDAYEDLEFTVAWPKSPYG